MATQQATLTSGLRESADAVWTGIMDHPFLVELARDELPDETLQFYFVQNVHYIDAAIRFTAEAAAKAPTRSSQAFCLELSQFGVEEVARQRDYVDQLAAGRPVDWEIAPTAHAYTNHLLAVASYEGTLELLVALMPCEWTYDEFGTKLCNVVKHPVAVSWLASFGSEHHNDLSDRYAATVEQLAEGAPPARINRLHELFRLGSRYEWMFWNMAYTRETWPV
jgi:thiaminase/transcriptional activator TenA